MHSFDRLFSEGALLSWYGTLFGHAMVTMPVQDVQEEQCPRVVPTTVFLPPMKRPRTTATNTGAAARTDIIDHRFSHFDRGAQCAEEVKEEEEEEDMGDEVEDEDYIGYADAYDVGEEEEEEVYYEGGCTSNGGLRTHGCAAAPASQRVLHPTVIPVCQVPGQATYLSGGLMCTVCATMLGMSVGAGLMPDPGCMHVSSCRRALRMIMDRSSRLQAEWVARDGTAGIKRERNGEMRQVEEVAAAIEEADRGNFFRTGQRVECFGPVRHVDACSEEMQAASDGSRGAGGAAVGPSPACIIRGLDLLLREDVGPGDSVVVTTAGHTICLLMSRGVPERWYVFDSLHGSLDCVMGPSENVFAHRFGRRFGTRGDAAACAHPFPALPPASSYADAAALLGPPASAAAAAPRTGLDQHEMYTAMIIRPGDVRPIIGGISSPCAHAPGTPAGAAASAPCTHAEVLERAARVIEGMRLQEAPCGGSSGGKAASGKIGGGGGGGVVQALRLRGA